jgi:hypothetical protein
MKKTWQNVFSNVMVKTFITLWLFTKIDVGMRTNSGLYELMRDFRISTFIVSVITRGFCFFVVFHKGFYVNPDAYCVKKKREKK